MEMPPHVQEQLIHVPLENVGAVVMARVQGLPIPVMLEFASVALKTHVQVPLIIVSLAPVSVETTRLSALVPHQLVTLEPACAMLTGL